MVQPFLTLILEGKEIQKENPLHQCEEQYRALAPLTQAILKNTHT